MMTGPDGKILGAFQVHFVETPTGREYVEMQPLQGKPNEPYSGFFVLIGGADEKELWSNLGAAISDYAENVLGAKDQ